MSTAATPDSRPSRRTLKVVFEGDLRRAVLPEAKTDGGPDGFELLVNMVFDMYKFTEEQRKLVRLWHMPGSGEPTEVSNAKGLELAFEESKGRGKTFKLQVDMATESSSTEAKRERIPSDSVGDLVQEAIKASAGLPLPRKIEGEGEDTKVWVGERCLTGGITQYLVPVWEFIVDKKLMAELPLAISIMAEQLSQGRCFRSSMDAALEARPKLASTAIVQKAQQALAAISKELEGIIPPRQVGIVLLDTWIDLQPMLRAGILPTIKPETVKQMIVDRAKVRAAKGDSNGKGGGNAMSGKGTTTKKK
eukprot:CAMPEP_0170169372 /NCGR_PEP_ID=MMETSP0040_2-20121228/2293_1 /TAXON_ID=641309 /ORGANISM="Lotharella oceanica, Strain CCMP622" /LENGTH=305 /DNA_ID=CAMNT_0010408081 /DNA_START=74 /DNA_END=991 /DNA_ORIENTATION=-